MISRPPSCCSGRSSDFFVRESDLEAARRRARRNKQFWFLVFDGNGLGYQDIKVMDMAEYYECIAAKEIFVAFLKDQQKGGSGSGG